MTILERKKIEKLANEAIKASKLADKNRFIIETLLSVHEMKRGAVTHHKSVNDIFKKIAI